RISGWSSHDRSEHSPHEKRRRTHTRVVGRPGAARSRTRRRRESWIRVVLNPHHEQRTTRRVSATSTTSFSTRSTTTAITRMRRRCRRTDIASGSIRAPSLLGDFDITEYRGALTLTLALPQSERLPNSTRSLVLPRDRSPRRYRAETPADRPGWATAPDVVTPRAR